MITPEPVTIYETEKKPVKKKQEWYDGFMRRNPATTIAKIEKDMYLIDMILDRERNLSFDETRDLLSKMEFLLAPDVSEIKNGGTKEQSILLVKRSELVKEKIVNEELKAWFGSMFMIIVPSLFGIVVLVIVLSVSASQSAEA